MGAAEGSRAGMAKVDKGEGYVSRWWMMMMIDGRVSLRPTELVPLPHTSSAGSWA